MTEPGTSLPVYQLRVVLRGISPLIWRRLLVPGDTTMAGPHGVLQVAFGWSGDHLHCFTVHARE
jgi:Plasmid pRiA4b ORF-3-like protein